MAKQLNRDSEGFIVLEKSEPHASILYRPDEDDNKLAHPKKNQHGKHNHQRNHNVDRDWERAYYDLKRKYDNLLTEHRDLKKEYDGLYDRNVFLRERIKQLREDTMMDSEIIHTMQMNDEHLYEQLERAENACRGICNGSLAPVPGEFDHGIGLDIIEGREPRLYQISDPDSGSLLPKYFRDIDGVEFQVQPGRGFSIKPHHRGD